MEEHSGTNLGASKNNDLDLDSFIKQTLAETRMPEQPADGAKAESAEKAAMGGTIISTPIPTPPKKEEPKPLPPIQQPASKPASAGRQEKPSEYDATFKEYQIGDIVKGKVAKIDTSGILVDIGYKAEGLLPAEEGEGLKVGDDIFALIENLENREGYVELSKKKADNEKKWKAAYDAYKNREVLEAKVTSAVNGGLVVDYEGIRGFIPASQVAKKPETTLQEFVGQLIPVKIIELNRRQGKVVLSNKMAEPEKHKLQANKILEELEVGQVKHGKVVSIKSFGAFVDIGGIEGLVHLSELSWKRVNHPSAVVKMDQELDVFILGVDKTNKKVALGLKELLVDPWVTAGEKYKVGQLIKVKVARLTKFGAFVDIDDQLEGLIHISELSTQNIKTPEEAVKPGDEVEVKIIRISPEEQRIGLSIRQVALDQERKEVEASIKEQEDKQKVTIAHAIAEKERQKQVAEDEKEIYEVIEPKNEISG
ncbi:MAG: S1 RNA-binding domain-containing protein [Candidatus Saganbacteria bacterium]|nr:S1 RNA-binding domain-containing protein [Candidatus Saganbacteria bacterium]